MMQRLVTELTALKNDEDLNGRLASAAAKKARKVRVAKPGRKSAAKQARAPKFRDSAGNVWSGRGPRPRWLRDAIAAGKKLEDFAVAAS